MKMNDLIEKVREIMKDRYDAKETLQTDEQPNPEVTKKDLYEQLKAFEPALMEEDMDKLYEQLNKESAIKLITNDIVEFNREFII